MNADLPQNVFAKTAVLTYLDTAQKELFNLSPNDVVLFFLVDVQTAFNDSGTDVVHIGKSTDDDFFAASVNVAAAGQTMTQQYELGDVGESRVVVTGKYVGQNSNATAGKAKITCVYATTQNH